MVGLSLFQAPVKNVTHFLWRYYLTLDKLFGTSSSPYLDYFPCQVGTVSCEVDEQHPPWPTEDHEDYEVISMNHGTPELSIMDKNGSLYRILASKKIFCFLVS